MVDISDAQKQYIELFKTEDINVKASCGTIVDKNGKRRTLCNVPSYPIGARLIIENGKISDATSFYDKTGSTPIYISMNRAVHLQNNLVGRNVEIKGTNITIKARDITFADLGL